MQQTHCEWISRCAFEPLYKAECVRTLVSFRSEKYTNERRLLILYNHCLALHRYSAHCVAVADNASWSLCCSLRSRLRTSSTSLLQCSSILCNNQLPITSAQLATNVSLALNVINTNFYSWNSRVVIQVKGTTMFPQVKRKRNFISKQGIIISLRNQFVIFHSMIS